MSSRIIWKAGCGESSHVRFGVGAGVKSLGLHHRWMLTNLTTQGYGHSDLGSAKVAATAGGHRRIDPEIVVEAICDRFRPRMPLAGCVFCCVDSIETRAAIWRSVGKGLRFWTDGRMLGEVIRVLVATDADVAGVLSHDAVYWLPSAARQLHGPQHDLCGQHCRRIDGSPIYALVASIAG